MNDEINIAAENDDSRKKGRILLFIIAILFIILSIEQGKYFLITIIKIPMKKLLFLLMII